MRLHVGSRLLSLAVVAAAGQLSPAADPPFAPKVDQPAPQIKLKSLDGTQELILTKYRGRKLVLVVFASWHAAGREIVAEWNSQLKPLVAEGRLAVMGIAEEQHADRCRLFAQWKDIAWPIAFDPLDQLNIEKLPLAVCVDEHGIVRMIRRDAKKSLAEFAAKTYPVPRKPLPPEEEEIPTPRYTRRLAGEDRTALGLTAHGNALVLSGLPAEISEAIRTFEQLVEKEPKSAAGHFRLGVSRRIRADSPEAQAEDAAGAVTAWKKAAALRPANQVFKSRYAQFSSNPGPDHDFYNWIEQARKEIIARGDKPVELAADAAMDARAKPSGERATPASKPAESRGS